MTAATGAVRGDEPQIRTVPLPNGARVAVTIQMALESWTEDLRSLHAPGRPPPDPPPDFSRISYEMYGGRTGMRRLLSIMDEYGIVGSCSLNGLCTERYPDLVREIAARGHEICGHGWAQDQRMAGMLDPREDHAVVRRTTEAIGALIGERPVGWSSHASRRGPHTVESLLREGYLYTRDFRDADVPYVVAELDGRRLLAMPRTDVVNDHFVVTVNGMPPSAFVEYFKRAFDQLYLEGAQGSPKVFTAVFHPIVFGHPWGAAAMRECFEHLRRHSDVWQTSGRAVAEHYLENLTG